MRLGEQWADIRARLPRDWEAASLELELALADAAEADRVALLLGPAAPERDGARFRLDVARRAEAVGTDVELLERLLARLDADGTGARLELAGVADRAEEGALAAQWRALAAALPLDWSHALVDLELDSSDFVDRAALLLAPANPTLLGRSTLRFRVARTLGYGVSTAMTRRCCERLDAERITGRISIAQIVSDARPVSTQGPVWRVGGRSA